MLIRVFNNHNRPVSTTEPLLSPASACHPKRSHDVDFCNRPVSCFNKTSLDGLKVQKEDMKKQI